jgi:hypothetical protein
VSGKFVGINNTSPLHTLDVGGDLAAGNEAFTVSSRGATNINVPSSSGFNPFSVTIGGASTPQFAITQDGGVSAPSYQGPATAPSGSCPTNGVWVFSQDGYQSRCNAGTWVATNTGVAPGVALSGSISLTAATSDTLTIEGLTSGYTCVFSPSNATAASVGTVAGYVSDVSTDAVTITHAATVANGATESVVCAVTTPVP